MSRSHYCQVVYSFDADVEGMCNLDLVSAKTIATISAARIWRNIGRKAALEYAAKRDLNMSLVRLACQFEAMRKAGFIFVGV